MKRASDKRPWLIFLAFVLFSIWPIKTKQQSLVPRFTQKEFGFSDLKPWSKGVNKENPATFKMIIGIDFAENPKIKNQLDQEIASQAQDDESLKHRARAHPWRYVKAIAFPIATFQRKNICELRLNLGNGHLSDNVKCQAIEDNSLVTFQFQNWLRPGIYDVTLESTGNPGHEVAPYYVEDKNHQFWILPFQGAQYVLFWNYLASLYHRNVIVSFFYFALVVSLLTLLASKAQLRWKALCTFGLSVLASNMATAPFSGHDETAHISMYHEALKQTDQEIDSDSVFN